MPQEVTIPQNILPMELIKEAPESAAYILLAVVIAEAEQVDVSMTQDAVEDVGEEVYEVEEKNTEGVVEEEAAHMKMGLISQLSPITLMMQSGLHYKTRQRKG